MNQARRHLAFSLMNETYRLIIKRQGNTFVLFAATEFVLTFTGHVHHHTVPYQRCDRVVPIKVLCTLILQQTLLSFPLSLGFKDSLLNTQARICSFISHGL